MNWPKVKEQFPNCYDELMELHRSTGLNGAMLLDQYILNNNRGYACLRFGVLKEIDTEKSCQRASIL